MGKIWLKAPDPGKRCCGCQSKTGPCSSCCSGFAYNLQTEEWDNIPITNTTFPFPASDCYIVKAATDGYSGAITGALYFSVNEAMSEAPSISTNPAQIASENYNGVSFAVSSGDKILVTIVSNVRQDLRPIAYLSTGFGINELIKPYFSGAAFTISSDDNGKGQYARSFLSTLSGGYFPSGAIISNRSGVSTRTLGYEFYANVPGLPFTTSTRSYPTGVPAPISIQPAPTPYIPPLCSPDGLQTVSTTGIIPFVGGAKTRTTCATMQRCWTCNGASEPAWVRQASFAFSGFGYIQPHVDTYNAFVLEKYNLRSGFQNGNRELCTQIFTVGATTEEEWINGPTDPCGPAHYGTTCFDGNWVIDYWYSTAWPTFSYEIGPLTGSVGLEFTKPTCVQLSFGYGGTALFANPGTGYVYPGKTEGDVGSPPGLTGGVYSRSDVTVLRITGNYTINPISFSSGVVTTGCPFSLP